MKMPPSCVFPHTVQEALCQWQTADLTPLKEYFLQRTDIMMSIKGDWDSLVCTLFEKEDRGNLMQVGQLTIYDDGHHSLSWYH